MKLPMNKKYYKILNYLYNNDNGEYIDISNLLKKNNIRSSIQIDNLHNCLKDFIELDSIYNYRGLLSFDRNQYLSESPNIIDNQKRKVRISSKGKEYFENLRSKSKSVFFKTTISGLLVAAVGIFVFEPIKQIFEKSNVNEVRLKNEYNKSHDIIVQNGDKSIGKIENQTNIEKQINIYNSINNATPKANNLSRTVKADTKQISVNYILDQFEYAYNNKDVKTIKSISSNTNCPNSFFNFQENIPRQPDKIEINQIESSNSKLQIGTNKIIIEFRFRKHGSWSEFKRSNMNLVYNGISLKMADCNFLDSF
jgi:hypothetical protein